jgi:biopolymer transport protein ExbB/TolQ
MVETFLAGGKMMWPLTLIGAGVLWLTGRTAWLIRQRDHRFTDVELSLQAILFWGAMSVVLGLLGTVIGWISASRAIALAGAVEPRLVWAGIGVTLYTLTFGVLIFTVAALAWFTLRQWASRASARDRRQPSAAV